MIEIPSQLKKAILDNKLIVFAGSGLSVKFNLPSWKQLVNDIITALNKPQYTSFLVLQDSGVMSPIEILEYLKGDHTEIRRYIKENFDISRGDFQLHKQILELSEKVITTNYDNAFERASNNTIAPTKPTSKFNISELNKTNVPYIFKLHGDFSEPDNCILFKEDYEKLYSVANAANEKLKTLFSEYTILFIGFSFNDPEINGIFNFLDVIYGNHNKHFILTKDSTEFEKFKFLEPIKIETYQDIDAFIENALKYKHNVGIEISIPENKSVEIVSKQKIALLYPNPIDQHIFNEFSSVISVFDSLDTEIYLGALNVKTLQLIEDVSLLIILTKFYKGNLYIEEDNLKCRMITLQEICENIPNENIPILLITNEIIDIDVNRKVINIGTYKNSIINKFIFKSLRNREINFQENEIKLNFSKWTCDEVKKGKSRYLSVYENSHISNLRKNANSIIGRVEEQSIIASKILNIRKNSKILNIKASGGTGKTTLIKKVSNDLRNRGNFKNGVSFISCENVKSYLDFEDVLMKGFYLQNVIDFKDYLVTNQNDYDILIILDNFETVTNLPNKEHFKEAIRLLEFSIDYASIVITSRESLSLEMEDIYSLTPLITDDAVTLFCSFYGDVNDNNELKILRSEILEDLLNNNPLAIKLVTQSRTRYKHINELKEQLKEHFFESINQDFSLIFNNKADLNIERTKSIYQSINYSYSTCTTLQKLALEILHLFPDGISLSNFKKCFSKKNSSNNISDNELRTLRDKSLIEDYDGILQLQPIIRRFAEFQFLKRSKEAKQKYYKDAFNFNFFIINVIELVTNKKTFSEACRLFSSHKNNLFNVLEYFQEIELDATDSKPQKRKFLIYIYRMAIYIHNEKQISVFQDNLRQISSFFSDLPYAELLINVINYNTTYYYKEFENSYKKMAELLPLEKMQERSLSNEDVLEKEAYNIISNVHSMEGYTLSYIKCIAKEKNTSRYLRDHLFYLGITDVLNDKHNFNKYQFDLMVNQLDIEDLENYISSLFSEEHLEIMQCTYILSKIKKIELITINKLVITNPYTNGLKELMYAFYDEDIETSKIHYEKALYHLYHIKYYYLEALYYYCSYLKRTNSPEFYVKHKEGLELCNTYYYQYLKFKFENIHNDESSLYICDYSYYPIDNFQDYIAIHNAHWKKEFKESIYNE
ncbi:hypothetical protein ABIC45_004569 [Mucilaginibacter rubeus]|uniref:SIR2 family protein n=1 Tax=Mucilaginibacter rubeus TaxID=2027860 RepID=UPI003391F381